MSEQNILYWSPDYFLNVNDFQAESNPAAFEDAHSVVKYRYTWTLKSEQFGKDILFLIENIRLVTEFHRHLSWIRYATSTKNLLSHEQGHFDLAESLRPEVTRNIQSIFENKWYPTRGNNDEQRKQFAREDSGTLIAKEIAKWEKTLHQKRHDYDIKTNYGQIEPEQTKFNDIFSKLR